MGELAPYIRCNASILLGLLLYSIPLAIAGFLDNAEQQKQGIGTGHKDLPDDRQPSLYTGDFGDCMGNSMVKLTRFNAAYYKDNLTVVFHLDGHTSLLNESLMMYIGFFAYGKRRFDLTFDPCDANIYSLCPMNASTRIIDGGFIPVAPADVSDIPPLAFQIPDFEGQAVLRFFSNSTRSQIACYVSTVANGVTLSHPQAVGSILTLLISVTFLLSIASIIYGKDIATMRLHYSHSSSLLVAFAVLHHIYLTGALSANWPRVLVAFWSNFAPFAGMIYSQSMQSSIDRMVEGDIGDIRLLGASPVGSVSSSLGGYNITDIYSTSSRKHSGVFDNGLWKRAAEQNYRITAPSASSTPEGFQWHGQLVKHGFPLPGNYSGFAGTLAMQKIPASNAFTTGLLWLIIMLVILSPLVLAIKLIVELLVHWKAINESRVDNLAYFRMNWLQFTTAMLLRSLLIGFGMIMFLTLFQFRFRSPPSSSALAAITFLIFFAGLASITSYIIYHRNTQFTVIPDQRPLVFERRSLLGVIPWFVLTRKNISASQKLQTTIPAVYPWWESCSDNQNSDESRFLLRYGWLTARFKDDSRYFFGIWLVYEFARACILGLGIASPIIQVAGLLILEVPFTIFLAVIAPFESKRLSAVIYALSFSNISSVLLSIPLQHQHDLSRIAAFAIGMVIIVIQSLLVFVLMLSMLTGIITSYISLSRRREIPSEQQSSHPIRMRYLEYIDRGANGRPMPPPSTPSPRSISPSTRDTGFTVRSVRRYPKIIDESPTPRNQIPSTPTSPQRMFHRLSAPSFHTMNPFTPSNAAGSAVSGFRNSDSFDPFYATTATDSVPSGFVNIDSLERRGDSVESLQYKLCRMTSIETAHSQSATGRDMSREHSLCLTDTFETAKSDFDPLTEFVTPPETRQTQGASQSKY